MKKIYLFLLLSCLSIASYAQTAASYGFSASNSSSYSSISSSGTASSISGDDNTQTSISIGFNFDFCGVTYTSVSACTNGWLSLSNSSDRGWINQNTTVGSSYFPSSGAGFLQPFWDDLSIYSGSSGYYQTTGTSPNRVFTFEWYNVGSVTGSGNANFQIKLYETSNVIDFIYGSSSYSSHSATIAIANSTSDYQTLSSSSSSPTASSTSFVTTISTSPASNQLYRWTPSAACSGSASAGTAVSSVGSACPSTPFTLSLTGYTAATGVTYQWQSSPDSTTWTNISGATTISYSTTESATRYYRCVITCTATSSADASAGVLVPYMSVCYCTPAFYYPATSCTSYNFALGGFYSTGESSTVINDVMACTGTGYEDRTSLSVNYMQSVTYAATVTSSTGSSGGYTLNNQIWIDFNDNGTFETTETVGGTNGYSGNPAVVAQTIAIPLTAPVGSHRMRIVQVYYAYGVSYPSIDPCPTAGYPYYYGGARDYTVNVVALPPCSGTPTGGTAAASTGTACPSTPFTLSLSGSSAASSLNYQWQSSPTGSTWTDISGATTITYSATATATTYYRCVVTCSVSGISAPSSSVLVNYISVCYCTPGFYDPSYACSTYRMNISELQVSGYSGTSFDDVASCDGSGYLDRTSLSVSFMQNNSYTANIYTGGYYTMNSQTWIDFDNDGTFASIETVGGVNSYYYSSSYTISIPITAPTGSHRMRVIAVQGYGYSSPYLDPCASSYSYGEVRDYSVNIVALPPCSGTPTAGTATSSIVTACPSLPFTLSVSGFTSSGSIAFQWQSSSDSSSWTNISGATGITYTTTESASTYYRCVVTCTASSISAVTAGIRVNYIGVCYCTPSYSSASMACSTYHMGIEEFEIFGESGTTFDDVAACDGSGYLDRTSLTVTLKQSITYTPTIYGYGSYQLVAQSWIDFNDDGTFSSSESVGGTSSYYYTSTSYNLTIPITAATGNHRMRVATSYYGSGIYYPSLDPCAGSMTYGEARDYTVNVIALPACSGTPTAGTAASDIGTACPSQTITLSLTGFSVAGSLTFQWQSSPDSSTWTNITGATSTIATTTETATRYYRCVVTCSASGSSSYSNGVRVNYIGVCYCTPYYYYASNACSVYGMAMSQFKLIGYSSTQINDSTACNNSGYLDRTVLSADMMQSISYSCTIVSSPTSYTYVKNAQVWIDFNNDGTFASSETIGGVNSYVASGTFTVATAASAATGSHRMRVECMYNGSGYSYPTLDPCVSGYYYGEARDYMINVVALPACTGTPTPGSASASTAYACPSTSFNLTLTGFSASSSLTFQWQSSPDSSTWTNITGATTSTYSATASASRYYHCVVTCTASGSSAISSAVYVNYISYCYCVPTYVYSNPGATYGIANFALNGYSGSTISDAGPAVIPSSGYEDRTSISIDLQQNGTYSGSVSYSSPYYYYNSQVWIDFNNDGTFASSEAVSAVFGSTGCATTTTSTYSISIPLTAATGNHRMRVRTATTFSCSMTSAMDPCNSSDGSYTYYYGLTRDYMVNIIALPPCSGTPTAGTASSSTGYACPSTSFTLSLTGFSTATGLTFQWQSSSDSSSWTNISGATSVTLTGTATAAMYYRCLVTCTASGSSAPSTGVYVNYISACYCIPAPSSASMSCSSYGFTIRSLNIVGAVGSISDSAACTGSGYRDRTTLSTTLYQGNSYTASIGTGSTYTVYTQFWIDFNNDGTFSSSETVGGNTTAFSTIGYVAVAIPSGASTGMHRMRLVMSYSGSGYSYSSMNPCMTSYLYGEARDYMINVQPLPACTGTPSAGAATSTTATACPSFTFTLGVTGYTIASGMTYQWQSSSDSTSWTNISGATSLTYATTETSAKYYRCVFTCTSTSGSSASSAVFVNYISGCYCIPSPSLASGSCSSYHLVVSAMHLVGASGSIHDAAACDGSGYKDRTSLSCTLYSGTSYTATVDNGGTANPTYCQFWIDFNNDATFQSTESVGGTSSSFLGATSVTLAIPSGSATGTFRMRLVITFYGSGYTYPTLDPCMTSYTYGEARDYTITVTPATCTGTPSAGTISASAVSSCTLPFTTTLTSSGYTTAPYTNYQWQMSTDSSSWSDVSGATSYSFSPTVTGTVYYRFYDSCTTSGIASGYTPGIRLYQIFAPTVTSITGSATVCVGSTTTLASSPAGGVWSSATTSLATVVSGTGVVTGVATGVDTIRYAATNSCGTTTVSTAISVLPLPNAGTISGASSVCGGTTITLSSTVSSGTWSSTATSVATAGATTGVVTGVSAGTASIVYSYTNSCGTATASYPITVNPAPTPGTISGPTAVCVGSNITLSETVSSGTWRARNGNATISSTGLVTGVTAGAEVIVYTYTNSCGSDSTTYNVTVNPMPNAGSISGPSNVCTGTTITLTDTASGGIWYARNTHATVSGGVVTGVTNGIDTIVYRVTNACGSDSVSAIITVNPSPVAGTISGSSSVCEASTITLTDAISGGTWSASNANATVSSIGVVTGVTAGVDTISYSVTNSCGTATATRIITVNPLPHSGVVSGIDTVCTGTTVTLSSTGTGGTWSRTNTNATVTSAGVVTGVAPGTVGIIYNVTNVCGSSADTLDLTVILSASAGSISGVTVVCEASSVSLYETDSTGSWSSVGGHTTVTGGVVTGISAGTDTIVYTVTNICGSARTTHLMVVNPLPQAGTITGTPTTICSGDTTRYIDTVSGAVWSSSDPSIATVNSYGRITGVSGGTAIISVTVTNTCGTAIAAAPVDINQTPIAGTVYGPASVCVSSSVAYGDTTGTPIGTWSSSASSIATVDATGLVYGLSPGTATIRYTITTASCGTAVASRTITVNALPYAGSIAGATSVCVGANTTLTHPGGSSGGTWSSSTTSVATVNTSTGVVRGVAVGTTTITYLVSTSSCGSAYATTAITVNPLPVAGSITGGTSVCEAASMALSNTTGTAGGVWTSSDTTRAIIGSGSGIVTGVLAGTATITYTAVTATCGSTYTTHALIINPLPVPGTITGVATVCPGTTTTLFNTATGGSWSAANSRATIASSGVVTGITPGLDTIYYTVTNGCGTRRATLPITIAPLPSAGSISGPATVCQGSAITLVDTISGGTWMASNSRATVTTGGVVTGVTVGSVIIYYSVVNYCGTATTSDSIQVLPVLAPSVSVTTTPGTNVCTGDYVSFTANPVNGGTAPSYVWILNGVEVGYGSSFGYIPSTGDLIRCKMISNAPCRTADTVSMPGAITMVVNDPVLPTVYITQSNDSVSTLGSVIVFNAIVTFGGTAPTYQWYVNGSAVAGATNALFNFAVGGPCNVYCQVTSNAPCAEVTSFPSNTLFVWADNTGINNVHASLYSMTLYPNPNNGSFVLQGMVNKQSNDDIHFEVIDMTGKILYTGTTTPLNGKFSQQVDLSENIVSGQYMLRVINENGAEFIHFNIMK